MQHTVAKGIIRPCCGEDRNLKVVERRPDDTMVRVCRACGRRHYRLRAEPGRLGLLGMMLGR